MRRAERGGIFFRLIGFLFLLAFLVFLYLLRHPLMRLAGELWIVNEPAAQSDVIVVLGDDNYRGDRAARAAELYRAGLAPQVVASGRLLRPDAGIAELIERDLEHDGVPAASIVKFPQTGGQHAGRGGSSQWPRGDSRLEAGSDRNVQLPRASRSLYFRSRVPARYYDTGMRCH